MPPTEPPYKFSAIVLCGGGSERMGFDKFRLPLGDRTFLECVLSQLLSSIDGPIVAVASEQSRSAVCQICESVDAERTQAISDKHSNSGPLEGIRVGLEAVELSSSWTLVTSCDVPLLTSSVIQLLQQVAECSDCEIEAVIPESEKRIYGLTAMYKPSVHPKLESLIEQRKLKVSGLASELNARMIDIADLQAVDPMLDSVRNLNLPAHYLKFLQEKGFTCPPDIEQQLNLANSKDSETETKND